MYIKQENTICWDCKNCSFSWIQKQTPVEGWTAKKTKITSVGTKGSKGRKTKIGSYIVLKCPEFMTESK